RAPADLGRRGRTGPPPRTAPTPADVGQQGSPGGTEEAKTAAGAVNSGRPGRRPAGPPHLPLRRHRDCAIEHAFRLGKQETGLMHYEGRDHTGLLRHLTLAAVVLGFVATH